MNWGIFLRSFYIPLDLTLSVSFLGFYQPGWEYDLNTVSNYLFLEEPYEFNQSPLDFVILSVFRMAFLSGIIELHIRKWYTNKPCVYNPLILFAVTFYSYSLAKLLALSWKPEQLSYPGLWLSVFWSIASSAFLGGLCYVFLVWKDDGKKPLLKKPATKDEGKKETDPKEGEKEVQVEDLKEEKPAPEEGEKKETVPKSEETTPDDCYGLNDVSISDLIALTKAGAWKQFRNIYKYSKPEWKLLTIGLAAQAISIVAGFFIPFTTASLISNILLKGDYDKLVSEAVSMTVLSFLFTIISQVSRGFSNYAMSKIKNQLSLDLFTSLLRQDINFFDSKGSNDIIFRLQCDCSQVSGALINNLESFLHNGMTLFTLAYMFSLSWRLTLVNFITLPLIFLISKMYEAYCNQFYEPPEEEDPYTISTEVLSTMRTVRSFAHEIPEAKRYKDALFAKLKWKDYVIGYGYHLIDGFFDNVSMVAVLAYGGILVINGLLNAEQMIIFYLYQRNFSSTFNAISYTFAELMRSVRASQRVFEYLHREPDFLLDGTEKPPVLNGEIVFRNVQFTYPSRPNNPVIQGLDLIIPAGKTVALCGPSGGGKSSIVSLIEHFYEQQEGSITIDGVPIKDIDHIYYHQKIGLVPQEPVLFSRSIRENILYGCDWATKEDMIEAAKKANAHEFIMEFEKGYDTSCGEKGVQMSGGQKQRIAIARALVRNPAVLILDEATSALDAESEHLVQEALHGCAKERTVLIIAHRLSTIEKADQIAVIQKGKLAQVGNHSELMQDTEGLYYSLVSRQLLGAKTGQALDL